MKNMRDDLGKRMKEYYEHIPKTKLMRRIPVAIRIDGKAFHSFTKGFKKPFDDLLMKSMQETMKHLCQNIQGCVLGYTQSDEITLILVDYKKLTSAAWFDYEIQKICSIAASMATMAFNRYFAINVENFIYDYATEYEISGKYGIGTKEYEMCDIYQRAVEKGAMFDARCFNIPKEEVTNLIYWRQLDATRNSIQMVGQANFSHKELQNKSCSTIQDMLHEKKEINWNDFPTDCKRGSRCIKTESGWWIVDKDIPIFKGDDREYVDKLIFIGETNENNSNND